MTLLQMSLSGAVLVAVILVLRAALLYRLPKRTFAALWWVALLRLLAPFSVPSVTSIYSLLAKLRPEAAAPEGLPVRSMPVPLAAAPGMISSSGASLSSAAGSAAEQAAAGRAFPWGLLWLAGALACALALAAAYGRCCREFRTALPVEQEAVERWKQTYPLRRPLDIRQSDRIDAPLTYGIFRPVILLPKGTDWSDRERLDYVLLHEYIHIRRWDAAAKLAAAAALCLHWFNPMVWVLYALFNRDIELACDEAVLRRQDGDKRADYARTLIDLEARKSGLMPLCSSFGKDANEERITAIMKTQKGTVFAAAAACVLVAAVAGVFATSPWAAPAASGNGVSQALADAHAAAEARARRSASQSSARPLPSENTVRLEYEDGQWAEFAEEYFKQEVSAAHIDEWWTYEDYCAFVEEKRAELENKLGTVDYGRAGRREAFTWTQELVDETMRRYESKRQAMENGARLAKSVCGNQVAIPYTEEELAEAWNGAWSMTVPLPDGTSVKLGPYCCRLEQPQALRDRAAVREAKWQELLAPYLPCGVTSATPEGEDCTRMYCEGKEVRCIYDPARGLRIGERVQQIEYAEDAIDLVAVYENGVLAGLRAATEEEMQTWTDVRRLCSKINAECYHLENGTNA